MSRSSNAASTIFSAFLSDLPVMSCKARPPSGSVTPPRTRAPCTSTSSSEPPPRSPTMPSGLWMPDTTPSAVRCASRLPDRIVIGVRQMRAASAMKARPLRASRQAAVAIAQILRTCRMSHSARKRLSASSAVSMASAASRPVDCTWRPRPANTFSLKIGVGDARQPLVDDETDRVGADIDDRDRRPVVEPALGRIYDRVRMLDGRTLTRLR